MCMYMYVYTGFELCFRQCPLDIISLSETWLRDKRLLLKYVKIPDLTFFLQKRNVKHGREVSVHVIKQIKYKGGDDINK